MRKQILTFVAGTGSARAGRVPMQGNGPLTWQSGAAARKKRRMTFGRGAAAQLGLESGLCSVDTSEAGPP